MGKISGSRRWKIFLDFGMKELFQYRVSLGSECCSFLFFLGGRHCSFSMALRYERCML